MVALDYASPWEFLVEVAAVDSTTGEVFYLLRHLCDLDPAATPELEATRPWLRP